MGSSQSSIDPPDPADTLEKRLRAEHKMELDKMSSTFKTALAFKNRKIKDLEDEVRKLKEGAQKPSRGTRTARHDFAGTDLQATSMRMGQPLKLSMAECKAEIESADMSESMQQYAVECATRALDKYRYEKNVCAYITKEFDKKYEPTWHCIVGLNFGSCVTHEKHFIYFYLGQVAILLYQIRSTMTSNQEEPAIKRKYPVDVPGVLASAQAFTSQISLLVDEIDRLRAETAQQKMELDQMSSTFKTALAFKNRKIRELKDELLVKNGAEENYSGVGMLSGASIGFNFSSISKLTNTPIIQKGSQVLGVEWVISVYKNDDHLACTVMGKESSDGSFPNKRLFLYLLKYDDGKYDTNVEFPEARVHEGTHIYELPKFILFKDVLDEKKSYVKDDSINVELDIQ